MTGMSSGEHKIPPYVSVSLITINAGAGSKPTHVLNLVFWLFAFADTAR
jgi:hypothetical protein